MALMKRDQEGKPEYIAAHVGGNGEAMADGVTGILVPPENPAALADAIVKLAMDEPLRASMGRAARERFVSRFELGRMVEAYARLYKHEQS